MVKKTLQVFENLDLLGHAEICDQEDR